MWKPKEEKKKKHGHYKHFAVEYQAALSIKCSQEKETNKNCWYHQRSPFVRQTLSRNHFESPTAEVYKWGIILRNDDKIVHVEGKKIIQAAKNKLKKNIY